MSVETAWAGRARRQPGAVQWSAARTHLALSDGPRHVTLPARQRAAAGRQLSSGLRMPSQEADMIEVEGFFRRLANTEGTDRPLR